MSFLPDDIEQFFSKPLAKETVFKIKSSSGTKIYTVDISGIPTCTCVAYAISKNKRIKALGLTGENSDVHGHCKHVEQVLDGKI